MWVADAARILCCCGCGIGEQLHSDVISSLRTSICHGYGPKKEKKRFYIYILQLYKEKYINICIKTFSLAKKLIFHPFPKEIKAFLWALGSVPKASIEYKHEF